MLNYISVNLRNRLKQTVELLIAKGSMKDKELPGTKDKAWAKMQEETSDKHREKILYKAFSKYPAELLRFYTEVLH